MKELRAALVAHVGGTPSATQSAIIDQLVQLRLRLALFERKHAEAGMVAEHDSRTYLAWANSYTRLLARLGTQAAAPRQLTAEEAMALFNGRPLPGNAP